MRLHTSGALAAAALAAVLFARASRAQDGATELARRELIRQAQDAARADDHAQALDFALRAGRIAMTPSLRSFIAEQQAAVGSIVQALANAEQCAREARVDAALRNRELILGTCTRLAASLSPRVGRVTVQPPTPHPAGLRVTVAGSVLSDALFGVPYVVAPGDVEVTAEAEGMRPFRQRVTVGAGETRAVPVALEPDPTLRARATTTGAARVAVGAPAPAPIVRPRGPGAAPFVLVGIGGASVVASAVLLGVYAASVGELRSQCNLGTVQLDGRNVPVCPDSAAGTRSLAETSGTLSLVTLGVGAALAVGGLVWAVAAAPPSREARAPRARLEVAPRADGVMFGVAGAL